MPIEFKDLPVNLQNALELARKGHISYSIVYQMGENLKIQEPDWTNLVEQQSQGRKRAESPMDVDDVDD